MKIYIGNLSYDTTADEIREAFAGFGEIKQVNLLSDAASGKSRGFGFVEMPGQAAAQKAIATLHGKQLNGRTLVVNEARARREPSAPGGRPARMTFRKY
jgi:RNA recognition motif-containing protein